MPTSPETDRPPETVPTEPDSAGGVSHVGDEPSEVTELRDELDRTRDRHRRALADLDNFRKRTARDTDRRVAEARRSLLREWLDAVDSVERALQMEPGDPGLTAVLRQMEAILTREGVTRVPGVGARFDPEQHEAIAVRPAADVADHTVLEVGRSGFALADGTVLRPAQVVVSRRPVGAS